MYKKRLKVALTFALMASSSNILFAEESLNDKESLLFGRSPLGYMGDVEQNFSYKLSGAALVEYDEQQRALSNLSGASLIRFDEEQVASEKLSGFDLLTYATEQESINPKPGFLTNKERLEFANIAYKANSSKGESQETYSSFVNRQKKDGYEVKKITGTTGYADSQEESTMGVMCFRGKEVVIATKGTSSAVDAITDVRSDRGGFFSTLKGATVGLSDEENEKNSVIAAQFLGNNGGKVHNGFLQTHNSMWSQIKKELISHAAKEGVEVSDLKIETVGHSLGGALQDLNQYHLMTDSILGYGTHRVEASFFDDLNDKAGLGFYALHRTEERKNTNVAGLGLEAAKALGNGAHEDMNRRVGEKYCVHVENVLDPVPHLPTTRGMGFNTPGTKVNIDTGHNPICGHKLGNIESDALVALNRFSVGQESDEPSVPMALARYTGNSVKAVTVDPAVYAATAVVDGVYKAGGALNDGVYKTGKALNMGYQALFSYFGH